MKKFSLLGILAGSFLAFVFVAMLDFAMMVTLMVAMHDETIPYPGAASLQSTPWIFMAAGLVRIFASVMGGYVAALLAKHDELLNGAVASGILFSAGVVSLTNATYTGIFLCLSPLFSMLGAYWCYRRRQAKN